jgi:hypothetical protein
VLIDSADFGMSRATDKGYYKTNEAKIPVKWSAIEVLEYGKFSTKVRLFGHQSNYLSADVLAIE